MTETLILSLSKETFRCPCPSERGRIFPSLTPGYVEELCIALRHAWKPYELFVIFTAYLDETDTHGPAPTVIMSGFLGHAYEWRQFEKKLAKIRQEHKFNIFHAKHFGSRSGEFQGWSEERCSNLLVDLVCLTRDELSQGFSIALPRDQYLNEYRKPPIPKKMNMDSQYGVCFRVLMYHLVNFLGDRGFKD